jgi:glucose/arabinose dehydrogenase
LHDLLLDPDFARNRTLYFTYFAPPPGEPGGAWPLHFLYEDVWTKPLAERRLLKIGMEKVARARLSADNTRLEDVRDLADGAERRIQLGRDGNLLVTGADASAYDSTRRQRAQCRARPGRAAQFRRRRAASEDGSIPKGNPFLGRANVSPWVFAFGLKDPEGAAIHPVTGDPWVTDHGRRGATRSTSSRPRRLRLAGPAWQTADARQTDNRKNARSAPATRR